MHGHDLSQPQCQLVVVLHQGDPKSLKKPKKKMAARSVRSKERHQLGKSPARACFPSYRSRTC